jgi:DCC-interacting protein 13 alpha
MFLTDSVHSELREESQRKVEQIETIERQSVHKYYVEVPVDMPFIPPNTSLSQKAGYLFVRR